MLFNVLAIIGDPTGCDAGLPHQLKTDLPTKIIRNLSLLTGTNKIQRSVTNTERSCSWLDPLKSGVSNTSPGGQNWPGKDSEPAHWMASENVNIGLLTVLSQVL